MEEVLSMIFKINRRVRAKLSSWSLIVFAILFASLPLLTNPSIGQSAILEATTRELNHIVAKQAASWNRGDIAEFMAPYWNDERLTFCSSGQTKRGWQATFENYKKKYPDRESMGKLTFSDLEIQELGPDAMLMIGKWHLERTEPVGGNFSLVWKKIDGKWRIVHDHSSALRPNE